MPILSLDNGIYSIDYDTEKLIDIVTNVQNMLFRNEGVYCVGKSGTEDGSDKTVIISQFAAGNAAMCTTMIFQIENYLTPNNFEPEYGIAPIPKYNDTQEEYYTHVQDQLSVMGIVSTVSQDDLPMVGAVMETIAEQSYKHVFPAYYENALSYKYLTDPEAVEMLNYIFSVSTTDWAYNLMDSALSSNIPKMIPTQEFIYSFFAKEKSMYMELLADFLDSYEGIPEFAGNP